MYTGYSGCNIKLGCMRILILIKAVFLSVRILKSMQGKKADTKTVIVK